MCQTSLIGSGFEVRPLSLQNTVSCMPCPPRSSPNQTRAWGDFRLCPWPAASACKETPLGTHRTLRSPALSCVLFVQQALSRGFLALAVMGSISPPKTVTGVGSAGSDLPIKLGKVEGVFAGVSARNLSVADKFSQAWLIDSPLGPALILT